MLPKSNDYNALRDSFHWDIPARLNMAVQVCDAWAVQDPQRTAIIDLTGRQRRDVTYGDLWALSRRVELALLERHVAQGDRVGVLLSQSPLTAAAHIAIWRMGAISVPLFKLFQRQALETRVRDAGLRVVVSDGEGAALLEGLDLTVVQEGDLPDSTQAGQVADTGPEDPAVLIYTSGTTGAPKGALHGHRVLTGHLPGVEMSHDFLGQEGDCLWTPADWAWIGGLFDVLMPGLALGVPV
ncbi:MAG TPA: AMP-binding protein, partial [Paracoccaceae bacterium]|nr:AMP-binding protein [Paracoccaceae bacterium]